MRSTSPPERRPAGTLPEARAWGEGKFLAVAKNREAFGIREERAIRRKSTPSFDWAYAFASTSLCFRFLYAMNFFTRVGVAGAASAGWEACRAFQFACQSRNEVWNNGVVIERV